MKKRSSSKASRTDWRRLRAMKDSDIELTGEHPELDVKRIAKVIVRRGLKPVPPKASVSLRVDVAESEQGLMKLARARPAALTNRSMPPGVVIPELAYPDVREAVEWPCGAFGFMERLRVENHRAQLTFGAGSVIVTGQRADPAVSSPPDSRPVPSRVPAHAVMVRVADVDSHFERAKRFGARVAGPPTDYPYGERQYSAEDPAGHRWTFSQTIADVDPRTWGGVLFESPRETSEQGER